MQKITKQSNSKSKRKKERKKEKNRNFKYKREESLQQWKEITRCESSNIRPVKHITAK